MYKIREPKDKDLVDTLLGDIYEQLEMAKFRINTHRIKNAGRGYTTSYGLISRRPHKVGEKIRAQISLDTLKNPALWELIKELGAAYDLSYTTVQVNKNYTTKRHKDIANFNGEPSYIISLGDYTDGLLYLEKEDCVVKIDAFNTMYEFDGSKTYHWNEPHHGTKYSLVFYTNKNVVELLAKESSKI
jgi:hypothetical protein